MSKYIITAPSTPGAAPSEQGQANTISAARDAARKLWRPWLRGQDVRIERPDGELVEYAGPAR